MNVFHSFIMICECRRCVRDVLAILLVFRVQENSVQSITRFFRDPVYIDCVLFLIEFLFQSKQASSKNRFHVARVLKRWVSLALDLQWTGPAGINWIWSSFHVTSRQPDRQAGRQAGGRDAKLKAKRTSLKTIRLALVFFLRKLIIFKLKYAVDGPLVQCIYEVTTLTKHGSMTFDLQRFQRALNNSNETTVWLRGDGWARTAQQSAFRCHLKWHEYEN